MADEAPKSGELPGNYASENERGLMLRIFSLTTDFPLEFRNWLKRFIENSDIKIGRNQLPDPILGFDPYSWPPGVILPYGGGTAPPYSLPCNGSLVSRVTYANLFAAIGLVWDPSAPADSFRLPDMRDRAPYGQGGVVTLAGNDGGALGTRGPKHHHVVTGMGTDVQGGHNHGGQTGDNGGHSHGGSVDGSGAHGHTGSTDSQGNHQHGANDPGAFCTTSGALYTVNSSSGSQRTLITGTPTLTTVNGAHTHNVTIPGGGDHSHGLSISGVGDHAHSIPSDGGHSHTITGGALSGGGVQDTPGYAGVLFVITTGAIT